MDVLPHRWDLVPSEAIVLQHQLARLVVHHTRGSALRTVAGVDVSYRDGWAYAVAVVFSYPELRFLEYARARRRLTFPYVPGLLSFREGPAVLDVVAALKAPPDMLMFDGHGVAHPRRFGLASHIGVILDIPSVGCAKTKLCGEYAEPGVQRGDYSYLVDRGETVGAVVRTRAKVKPVFVSIGHCVDLGTSVAVVLKCCDRYRLPEPTRWADLLTRGTSAQAREGLRSLIAARRKYIQSPV
jgi:deoxyribonuclease V